MTLADCESEGEVRKHHWNTRLEKEEQNTF